MDYETARAIALEVAPDLHIDDFNPSMPSTLVVRKTKGSTAPFNIMLPVALDGSFHDIPGRDAIPGQPAIEPTDDHPGRPAIPDQPAVKARTKAGLIAEAERNSLIDSLNSAKALLP